MFGRLLQDKYTALGLPCFLAYRDHPPEIEELTFLQKFLAAYAK